jgi:hypothetical protein
VTVSGTGVAVGKKAIATLTVRDAAGTRVPNGGATVSFATNGGTSVLTVSPVTDVGDGTYRATLTGVTEGTAVTVTATIDNAAVTTPGPTIRVVNPVTTGLTLSLDAENADGAASFGGKLCPASGLTTWADLSTSGFDGTLTGFAAAPCATGSGWNGDGTPERPHRLTFDGADDQLALGAVNGLTNQTILAWVRKSGVGISAGSGTGGLTNVFPIVTKGTAEAEVDNVDINYYLGLTSGGRIGVDFEQSNPLASGNNPLTGGTALTDDRWVMIGFTYNPGAGSRVIYLDGAPDGSSMTSNTPSGAALSLLVIGGSNRTDGTANGRFKGDVAIVLTYDRALSATEVAQNCTAHSSRFGILGCPK